MEYGKAGAGMSFAHKIKLINQLKKEAKWRAINDERNMTRVVNMVLPKQAQEVGKINDVAAGKAKRLFAGHGGSWTTAHCNNISETMEK